MKRQVGMHDMKILLISPPTKSGALCPPLSLAYIASSLESHGHNVKIIDPLPFNYKYKDFYREIRNHDSDVIGISCTTPSIYNSYKLAKIAKEINPNSMVIFGGAHPTVLTSQTFEECPYVDVIVRGEGEITFVELLDRFEKNKGFSDVKGVSYRDNGRIVNNPDRPLIQDLDSIPLPAYHLIPMEYYKNQIKQFSLFLPQDEADTYGFILTSRGCPYNCIFCASSAFWGRTWRARSPENVIEELKLLNEKHKIKTIEFIDDTFTVEQDRVEKICDLIKKEDFDIKWSCLTRVKMINKDIVTKLKNSKCFLIGFGLESGVQQVLDFLQKNFTLQDTINAVKTTQSVGLETASNFIIGVPGETKQMINQTINFARKLNLSWTSFSVPVPYPGTYLFDYADKNNLLITKDWSKYTRFNPVIKVPGMPRFEVKGLLFKANLSNYLRTPPSPQSSGNF